MTPVISVICPVRDEEANIKSLFTDFLPISGYPTEFLFVEGGSIDKTWPAISRLNNRVNAHGVRFRALHQVGQGKAGAVAAGFDRASGKYLMIADADMSIRHPDLEKIFSLFTIYGDNIIGSGNRLAGLPKPPAFYWINYLGNYFFRLYYSLILGTPVLDFACGTKAMTKSVWKKVSQLRQKRGFLDSWGDIDWLYYGRLSGAALRFVSIGYHPRLRGQSKLQNPATRFRFAGKILGLGLIILGQQLRPPGHGRR